MKKAVWICFLLIIILSISFILGIRHSFFTNFWNKTTGNAIYNLELGTTVYECGNITEAGTYTLNQSITTSETCIRVQANDVTLDLAGLSITGDDSGSEDYGIYILGYNNSKVMNGKVYNFYNGVYLSTSLNNTLTNITTNSNKGNGIYVYLSSNNNLTNIIANSGDGVTANGIVVQSSSNNTLTNITTNSNKGNGISLSSSSNNNLIGITSNGNVNGISLSSSSNNNLTNITATSNYNGIYFFSSSNNLISMSSIIRNREGVFNQSANNFTSNQFLNNIVSNSVFSTNSPEGNVGSRIDFNLTMKYINGSDCALCSYKLELYPYEASLGNSSNGALITGNFTPTKQGIYSLKFNITDENNNFEIRKYVYLIGPVLSSVNYYFRSAEPDNIRLVYVGGYDSGSLLFDKPASDENRFCTGWVQFFPDVLPNYLYGIYKDINYSIWYTTGESTFRWTGVQKYTTALDWNVDYNVSIEDAITKTFRTFNFSVDWANDYFWSWYFMSIKLRSGNPYIYSNSTNPSYANITYAYSNAPAITSVSSEDADVLSATMDSNTSTSANITLEGTGTTDITIKMPNSEYTYNVSYDGADCGDNEDCTVNSQENGELNLTVTLGSIHTLYLIGGLENVQVTSTTTHLSTSTSTGNGIYQIFFASTEQLEKGYVKVISERESIRFTSGEESHNLKVNKVENSSINITISSSPQTFTLHVGDDKKINLNSDNFYDILVHLDSIKNNQAEILLKYLNETISATAAESNSQAEGLKTSGNNEEISIGPIIIIGVLILSIILVIMALILVLRNRMNERKAS